MADDRHILIRKGTDPVETSPGVDCIGAVLQVFMLSTMISLSDE
jgi:hypothetical protein